MELVIKNNVQEVETLGRFVLEFGEAHHLPQKLTFQINLALEELVSNVIFYGYEDEAEHEIRLRLTLEDGRLCAEIDDDGRPFNPAEAKPPDLDLPIEERPIGGLGIHIVKNIFDKLDYKWVNGRNNLILVKERVMLDASG